MQTYIIKLTVQTGGFEKHTIHLVQGITPAHARKEAIENESHDPESLVYSDADEAEDMHGEFLYTVSSTLEVDPADLETLRKYLR